MNDSYPSLWNPPLDPPKPEIHRNNFVHKHLNSSMKYATMCALLIFATSIFAGCFESDSDGDGFADSDDNCPNISNPLQADHDISGGIDGGNECDEDDDNEDDDEDDEKNHNFWKTLNSEATRQLGFGRSHKNSQNTVYTSDIDMSDNDNNVYGIDLDSDDN